MMLRIVITGLFTLCLFACATGSVDRNPTVQITGMIIENQTLMYVTAVRLMVPATGNFVSCGNIIPESSCSTTFPEAAYSGNPVEITWSQGGQIHSTGQFVIQLPAELNENKSAIVRVIISGPESAGAIIVESPE